MRNQIYSCDLILYALGIGCTSKCGEERFLIENQHNFEAFPLYPLALGFTSIPKTIIDAKKKKPLDTSKKGFDYAFWGIHPFPPYSMRHYSKNGTFSFIPERFIVSNNESDEDDEDDEEDSNSFNDPFLYPMIHISQSLSIFHNMPVPCRRKDQEDSSFNHDESENPISIVTKTSIVKVVPKRIGTFVTTKTDFYLKETTRNKETHNSLLLSTGYSCSLILNVPPEKIKSFHDNKMLAAQHNGRTPTNQWNNFFSKDKGVPPGKPNFTHRFNISDDQAILYRLSGDYNPLHVDSNISSSFLSSTSSSSSKSSHTNKNKNKNKTRPILHGLCTLGFAVRAALQYCDSISGRHSDDKHVHQLVHVFTKFKRPVFIGDELLVHIWNITHSPKTLNDVSDTGCIDLLFQVANLSTKSLCLDEGVITVKLNPGKQSLGLSKL